MSRSLQVQSPTRRGHSNTVSGDRPPAIDTTLASSYNSSGRRNSEGSPGLPPPINISAPTPISPSQSPTRHHFSRSNPDIPAMSTETATAVINSNNNDNQKRSRSRSRSSSPAPNDHLPPSSHTSAASRLFGRKSRSRGSSLSTTYSTSDLPDVVDKIKEKEKSLPHPPAASADGRRSRATTLSEPRRPSDETEDYATSEGGRSSIAAGSIATACNLETANAKRNQEFHALFRSVPEDDPLIEDFGCALQKEILLQGRIYISEQHICFNANIFGWVTNLVIAFTDIIEIEKRSTALFIPNAIQISTSQAKHFFASFLSRDQAYDLMADVWRMSKPDARPRNDSNGASSLNLDDTSDRDSGSEDDDLSSTGTAGTFTDEGSLSESESESDGDALRRQRHASLTSLPAPKNVMAEDAEARRRAVSEAGARPKVNGVTPAEPQEGPNLLLDDNGKQEAVQPKEKTECACMNNGEHYPNVVMDEVYDGTIQQIYNLLYTSDFVKQFLIHNQKSTDVNVGEWQRSNEQAKYVRDITYVKHLNASLGPKTTRCILKEEVRHLDLENYITQVTTTQTPDVPTGSSFSVKTRVCLMWAGKSKVRMLVTVAVEFTKSSWIKSTIEKASIEGQQGYYKDLDVAMRKRLRARASPEGGKRKDKKRKKAKRKQRKEKAEVKEEAPETLIAKLTTGAMAAVNWILSNATLPTTSQLTVICMLLLVGINFYIATKMSQMDQQLAALMQPPPERKLSAKMDSYEQASRDRMWDWLGKVDPEHEPRTATVSYGDFDGPEKNSDRAWDLRLRESQKAKDMLDHNMANLEKMIQRAGQNMEQVTQVVNRQRERIVGDWSSGQQ